MGKFKQKKDASIKASREIINAQYLANKVIQPWDRLEGESEKAYSYFLVYREYRDFEKTRMEINKKNSSSLAMQGIYNISCMYNWRERIRAYDSYMTELELSNKAATQRAISERALERAKYIQDKAFEIIENKLENVENKEELSLNQAFYLFKEARRLEGETIAPNGKAQTVNNTNIQVNANNINLFDKIAARKAEFEKLSGDGVIDVT